jgi:methyl-accepting chemotaxis protein
MKEIIKNAQRHLIQQWLAWTFTLVTLCLIFMVNLTIISLLAVLVMAIIWARQTTSQPEAFIADETVKDQDFMEDEIILEEPCLPPSIAIKESGEALQVIMGDVDAVVKQEVEIVKTELTQVNKLIAESIETLNDSFHGLHQQTTQQYQLVLSLLANLGGGKEGMSIENFSIEIAWILYVALITKESFKCPRKYPY